MRVQLERGFPARGCSGLWLLQHTPCVRCCFVTEPFPYHGASRCYYHRAVCDCCCFNTLGRSGDAGLRAASRARLAARCERYEPAAVATVPSPRADSAVELCFQSGPAWAVTSTTLCLLVVAIVGTRVAQRHAPVRDPRGPGVRYQLPSMWSRTALIVALTISLVPLFHGLSRAFLCGTSSSTSDSNVLLRWEALECFGRDHTLICLAYIVSVTSLLLYIALDHRSIGAELCYVRCYTGAVSRAFVTDRAFVAGAACCELSAPCCSASTCHHRWHTCGVRHKSGRGSPFAR